MKVFCYLCSCILPIAVKMSFEEDGAVGWSTTLWKSDTVRFVFGLLERRKLKLLNKDKCRGDAYGCVYHAQPECAEGHCALMHTFGCIVYIPSEGIKSVRSIKEASYGLSHGTGSRRYPRFFCIVATKELRTL